MSAIQMADVTIKKADGSTDILFTAKTPSAGDSVQALWRSDTVGTSAGTRPAVTCVASWNGPKTARKINVKFTYPFLDATTGAVLGQAIYSVDATVPASMPDADVSQYAAQSANFVASSLIKSVMNAGFAPQ